MSIVEVNISTSLDGFITGDITSDHPDLGEGGDILHAWFQGDVQGPALLEEALFATAGAVVTSRKVYDLMDGWGKDGFYGMPVFVLTHRARSPEVRGQTTFTFVTDGIARAIDLAKIAAGAKKVHIMGGATVVQQALRANLVDRIQLHIAPILLGSGTRLFDNLPKPIFLEHPEIIQSDSATHLRFPVTRQEPTTLPREVASTRQGLALRLKGVAARLPARDLARARAFYEERLGLSPTEERLGGLRYQCGTGWFALFESSGTASGTHTQVAFEVDDLAASVRELRERGVTFEQYDEPGLRTVDGIATIDGNYPSTGSRGERAAWFQDSEGNLLSLGQSLF